MTKILHDPRLSSLSVPLLAALALAGCVGKSSAPVCTASQTLCTNVCVDTSADRENCGACGNACGNAMACSAGKCVVACPAGETACGDGKCHDLTNDNRDCGACSTATSDKSCAAGKVCSAGACATSCGAGTSLCGDGRCHDLTADNGNCGACSTAGTTDKACATGLVCGGGVCTPTCVSGSTLCSDGKCHDLTADNGNCGACSTANTNDKACAAGKVCASGACAPTCAAGTTLCSDNKCHDLTTDSANCGACSSAGSNDKACLPGRACVGGSCAATCSSPLVSCNNTCTDTRGDPDHCGSCQGTCPALPNATRACSTGACILGQCNAGFLNCNGVASDGCEVNSQIDANNCGACGKVCANGAPCKSGVCSPSPTTGTSCLALRNAGVTTDGVYTITQGGAGTTGYRVYCDMTTDGGGWMVMIYIRNPSQWSTGTFTDFGTVGDTANGFASGATLQTANPQLTQTIIIYKNLIENGSSLGQQWMEHRRTDGAPIPFQSVQAATGWNYFDSFGKAETSGSLNACTHGCGTYRTFGMYHDYSTIGYHGTQGGDYGCRDGNNICWVSRSAGCNVGAARCAYLVGSGEGVVYGAR